MFGGTAKTYCEWKMDGVPFKDGKYWYIMAIHPRTGIPKKVRWYSDQAHNDLMPNTAPKEFPGKCFGFESADDYVLAINKRHLTDEELDKFFKANWTHGGNWKYGEFFGGIWYAPKSEPIPPIAKADKMCKVSWPNFVKAGRQHVINIEGNLKGFWFQQEV